MQKLYTSEDRVIIYLLQAKLAERNITCIIKNEAPCGPAAGEISPVIAWPELWVVDTQYFADAMHIIQQELARQNDSRKNWKCPQCGELLEGQFDICWKCGHNNNTSNIED